MNRKAAAWALVLATVALLPLWAGGVRPGSALILALAALAALLLDPPTLTRPVPFVLWPLAAAAIYCSFLALPLPLAFGALSPTFDELRRFVWLPLSDPPRFAALALDAKATALDAARLWATLSLALVVARRAQANQSVSGLFLAVALGGALQLGVCLWRYDPAAPFAAALANGAFINPNHQAAFFNLSWSCALAAALLVERRRRVALLFLAALLFGAAVCTFSRAGIGAALVGVGVWAFLAREQRDRRWFVAAALVLSVIAFFGYTAFDAIKAQFVAPAQWEKLDIYPSALSLVPRFLIGTGRDGFAWAFNLVRETPRFSLHYDYVENEYLQALIDYGPIAGALAVAAAIYVVVRALLLALRGRELAHRPKTVALVAALVMLALHNFFDFNWELCGIFFPTWLLLASLGRSGVSFFGAKAFSPPRVGSARAQWLAALLASGLCALGLFYEPHRLEAEQDFAGVLAVRPLDSYAMLRLGGPAWINRALLVDPGWAAPHVALARWLCASPARAQGRLELKLALDRDPALAVAPLLRTCVDTPADWLEVEHAELLAPLMPDAAIELLVDREAPSNALLAVIVPRLRRDPARWQTAMDAWRKLPPTAAREGEEADAASARGDQRSAIEHLASALGRDEQWRPRYVDGLIAAKRWDEADAALAPLARDCSEGCRAFHVARAKLAMARERKTDALIEWRTILSRTPGDSEAALNAATLLSELSQTRAAIEVLRASERAAANAQVQARLAELLREEKKDNDAMLKNLYLGK